MVDIRAVTYLCGIAMIAGLGDASAFEYKGVPLGTAETAFSTSHPSFKCGPAEHDFAERTCAQRGGTYAGAQVKGTTAQFVKGRLCQVSILMAFDEFISLQTTLREVLGPPTNTKQERLPASAAPHKTKWTLTWSQGTEHIKALSYVFGFNSLVELTTDTCRGDIERLREKRRKSRAKDL
jgi:hypothetical protein